MCQTLSTWRAEWSRSLIATFQPPGVCAKGPFYCEGPLASDQTSIWTLSTSSANGGAEVSEVAPAIAGE